MFGINAEGRKDDRIISALETEMKKVFDRNMNYPIIVIATSESSDLPVNLKRLFLENISLQYLDQTLRSNILSCLLKTKQILNEADLLKIAGLCSDFILADFEAFILHTIKIKYNIDTLPQSNETCTKLLDVDFNKAYGKQFMSQCNMIVDFYYYIKNSIYLFSICIFNQYDFQLLVEFSILDFK